MVVIFFQTASSSRSTGAQSEDQAKEIAALKKEVEKAQKQQRDFGKQFLTSFNLRKLKDMHLEILKKQSAQNNAEYDRLATELNDLSGNKSNKRVD